MPEVEEFAKSEREKVIGDGSHLPPNRHAVFLPAWHAGGTGKNPPRATARMYSDPDFHKEYKKLVGEEPTPLSGEDMERALKELPRDPEIVELFKSSAPPDRCRRG